MSGTADDAATANDSGTLSRSEQINANCSSVKSKPLPSDRSVAEITSVGASGSRFRSPNVLPRYSSSKRRASRWLRPIQGEPSSHR